MCVSHSVVSNSLQPIADQALLSIGFSRQEYWNGLPSLSPRDLPDPGIEPRDQTRSPLKADSLPSELPGKLTGTCWGNIIKNKIFSFRKPLHKGSKERRHFCIEYALNQNVMDISLTPLGKPQTEGSLTLL